MSQQLSYPLIATQMQYNQMDCYILLLGTTKRRLDRWVHIQLTFLLTKIQARVLI